MTAEMICDAARSAKIKIVDSNPPALSEEFDMAGMPTLKNAALHGAAGEIAVAAAKDSEVDPVAVLATALAYASAMFGAKPNFKVGDTPHLALLFVVIVGESSRSRKSSSNAPVNVLLKKFNENSHVVV